MKTTITNKGIRRHPRGGYGQYEVYGYVNGIEVTARTTDSEAFDWWNDESEPVKQQEALELIDSILTSKFEDLLHDDSWLASFLTKELIERSTAEGELKVVVDNVRNSIKDAWLNWDETVLATYYEDEKPEEPTDDFIENWIENEPIEMLLS